MSRNRTLKKWYTKVTLLGGDLKKRSIFTRVSRAARVTRKNVSCVAYARQLLFGASCNAFVRCTIEILSSDRFYDLRRPNIVHRRATGVTFVKTAAIVDTLLEDEEVGSRASIHPRAPLLSPPEADLIALVPEVRQSQSMCHAPAKTDDV